MRREAEVGTLPLQPREHRGLRATSNVQQLERGQGQVVLQSLREDPPLRGSGCCVPRTVRQSSSVIESTRFVEPC